MRAINLAVFCLLGTLLTPSLQAAPADCGADSSRPLVLSSQDQQLLEILGGHASNSHTPTLIRYNDQTPGINQPILGNYALCAWQPWLCAMAIPNSPGSN